MKYKKPIFCLLMLLYFNNTMKAQIPVELFGGDKRATIDVMFFKYFKNHNNAFKEKSPRWLFFNRNRAGIDYRMTSSDHLPQFGFTEAVSYTRERLRGFAPVMVLQVLNRGIFPKAGMQYSRLNKNTTIFTWLVCETLLEADIDYFLLFRYTPKLTEKIKLFTQLESINSFPIGTSNQFMLAQRIRLGIQNHLFQLGVGFDFSQSKSQVFIKNINTGLFIRHEF